MEKLWEVKMIQGMWRCLLVDLRMPESILRKETYGLTRTVHLPRTSENAYVCAFHVMSNTLPAFAITA